MGRVTLALLVVIGADLAAQPVRAWDDLYREAVRHVQRQEWKPAEDKLLRAMTSGPPSGRDVIRGIFNRDDYFPEFYLGVVLVNTGRPAEALVQFQVARKRGLNTAETEFRQIAALEARAEDAVAESKNAVVRDRRQQFTAFIDQSHRLLAQERFDDAEAAAKQARELNVDNALADSTLQNVGKARVAARFQDQLNRSRALADLRRLLAEYENSGVPLDELRKKIASAEADALRTQAERSAMLEFFGGNFPRAIAILTEAEKTVPLSARGYFYRACSLASLATRGKSTNETQLREARRQYSLASQAPELFRPDLRYISPRLLERLRAP